MWMEFGGRAGEGDAPPRPAFLPYCCSATGRHSHDCAVHKLARPPRGGVISRQLNFIPPMELAVNGHCDGHFCDSLYLPAGLPPFFFGGKSGDHSSADWLQLRLPFAAVWETLLSLSCGSCLASRPRAYVKSSEKNSEFRPWSTSGRVKLRL